MPNNVFEGLDEILARQKQAEERSRQEHEEILEAINQANAKTALADPEQRAVYEAAFKVQKKYYSLYGYVFAQEYNKLT